MKSVIEEIVKEAGRLVKKSFYSNKNDQNPALHIEDFLKKQLSIIHPESCFFGEENGITQQHRSRLFAISAIDGMENFLFGVPYFALSLAEILEGSVNRAMVYNPLSDDFFYADRQHPATLNGKPIHVSSKTELKESLVTLNLAVHESQFKHYHEHWPQVFSQARKAMALLSPSLNLCSIACGKTEGFIDAECPLQSQIAGSYILKRAGGSVHNYQAEGYDFHQAGIVATNGRLELS